MQKYIDVVPVGKISQTLNLQETIYKVVTLLLISLRLV